MYKNVPGFKLVTGTFSNEDRNANEDGSEKSHFRLTLNFFYFFMRFIRVLFSLP